MATNPPHTRCFICGKPNDYRVVERYRPPGSPFVFGPTEYELIQHEHTQEQIDAWIAAFFTTVRVTVEPLSAVVRVMPLYQPTHMQLNRFLEVFDRLSIFEAQQRHIRGYGALTEDECPDQAVMEVLRWLHALSGDEETRAVVTLTG